MIFFKKIKKSIFGQFLPIFMNLNHVLKKVGRGRDHNLTYLKFDIFWIYMLGGIQNQLRFFLRALLGSQVPQHDVKGSLIYIHCGCVLCILPRVTRLPIAFVLDLRHDRHGYAWRPQRPQQTKLTTWQGFENTWPTSFHTNSPKCIPH
jgi:hypothetical protein